MKLLAIIIVLIVVPGAFAQDAKLMDAARKEGKLVLYGTMQSDIFEVLQKAFEKKTGIAIDYWRSSATKVLDAERSARRQGAFRSRNGDRRLHAHPAHGRYPGQVRLADEQGLS
jgi:hypothetical protein